MTYREATVTLEAGDVLAMLMGRLMEAGPTRAAMLGGNGVAALLRGRAY